ncbi:MAG: sugar phosphate isomerase/epimerase [Anaerolineaceae bacterium]|nr:sugar phosphate isomerase/epimerase [Anaerolineaceae bacterium]
MRLGFYSDYSEETAAFAAETGFTSLQLSAWPDSAINPDTVSEARLEEILDDLRRRDIEISALGYYPNYLAPDAGERAECRRYFLALLDLAQRMQVPVVSTFVGCNPHCTVEDNLGPFQELFTEFCQQAGERGLRIAIENCPMIERRTNHCTNLAFSPEIWERMFELVPSPALGLEMDPSHLVWLGIDYIQAVRDFGERIYHAHAKDTEVRRDVLARVGIYGQTLGEVSGFGLGWWRGRAPGWGEVDWPAYISALIEVGYQGNLDIEHEEDLFDFSELVDYRPQEEMPLVPAFTRDSKGLLLGYQTLAPLVPGHLRK